MILFSSFSVSIHSLYKSRAENVLFNQFSVTLRNNVVPPQSHILFTGFSVSIRNLTKIKDENTIFNQFAVTMGSDAMVAANREALGIITRKK